MSRGVAVESREIEVSIVVPVKDEAENIGPLATEITLVMERQSWGWECIWVDDGSTDQSLSVIRELARSDTRHRFISFERNAGKSAAYWAAFKAAKGPIIATVDGDGQNDPADIPALVQMVSSGRTDMAHGYRFKRRDNFVRKASSRIANRFRTWLTGNTVRDVGCATRAFSRDCVLSFPTFSGMHRFLPTLAAMKGFRLAELSVNHRPRTRGSSKYSINNRLWVGLFDAFGVMWLNRRAFHYSVKSSSDSED